MPVTPTPVAGQLILSSWGIAVTEALNRCGATLTRTTAHSATTLASTTITWTAEVEDTHGFIAVPGTTVTIPTGQGGLYSITAYAIWTTNAVNAYVRVTAAGRLYSGFSVGGYTAASTTVPLAAGDTVIVTVYNPNATENVSTAYLSVNRVGL